MPAKSNSDRDPRIYFAAERTLLAWVRTGIAVIGLGFVVARFGLFLRMLHAPSPETHSSWNSTLLGTTLVLLGSAAMLVAVAQHYRFSQELGPSERPLSYWLFLPLLFGTAVAAIGMLLAAHLAGAL